MANSIYKVNKGINKSIEFKGLKAQYIWYLGGGLLALLIFFAVLYIIGINAVICIAIIMIAGTLLFIKVYGMSRKYGEHGMMKTVARKQVPKIIKVRSRSVFVTINNARTN
jgi:hypothetical protein